jgi:hypothetical protein
MNFSKKLLLALTLLASQSARADYWSDLVKWAGKARQSGLLAPIGLLPSPCTDKRTIHGEEYAICPGSNFEGKILAGADLRGANLTRANLKGANLSHANLTGATLEGAQLNNATLENIILTGAKLKGANLENCVLDHNADLSQTDLSNAILIRANLEGAKLNNAILTNANLSGAKLNDANLTNAVLRGANLSEANIIDTNFQAADLTDCKIDGITFFAGAHGNVYRGPTFVDIQNLMRPIAAPAYPSGYRAFRKPFSLRKEEPSEIEVEYEQPEQVRVPAPRAVSPAVPQSPQAQLMQPVFPPAQGQLEPVAPAGIPAVGQRETASFVGMQPVEPTPVRAPRAQHPISISEIQRKAAATSTQKATTLPEHIRAIAKNKPTRPITSSQDNPPADIINEIPKTPEIGSPAPTAQSPLPTRSSELVPKDKEEADEQPKPAAIAVVKQKEAPERPATAIEQDAVAEQPKPLESTLIKRYLTKVDLLFTPNVKLNNNYVHELNALGEMLQHYPALLRIHAQYVARPAEEFYKHLPKAEVGLQHKRYTESKLTELLDDLFKKIRTTLWSQDDMKKWVARIIALTFDKEEKSQKYIRRDNDKNSVINAIKQSFTTQLKKTVRPLMNAQAPIAQLYAYFDEINNQLNAITFRDITIGPMVNLYNSLVAAVYEKDKKLKSEFEPFKTTIDKLLVQIDTKVALPNAAAMDERYATIEEVRKAFFKIREAMNREYEKRGKP